MKSRIILSLLLACVPFAACADTLTLQEALGIAYETNPNLAAQQAALRATDEDVARANAGWRPQVSAGGTYGYQEFKISGFGTIPTHPLTGVIAVTQPLFRGGRTVAQISRAMALVRAGEAQLTATEQTVLLNAASAYMDVVRDGGALDLNRRNVELLKKQSESTSLQFKAGSLTRTDVAQADARLAGAKTQLAVAEANYAASQATFLQVIGTPPETLEALPALPDTPDTKEDVLAQAEKQNPALVQAKENARAADYTVDDALGALLPQVSVTGQYQYSEGSLNNGVAFGIGGTGGPTRTTSVLGQVNVPIFQGGAEHAAVRQAKQLRGQAQLNVTVADRAVRQAVVAAFERYEAARAAVVSGEQQVAAARIAFEGVTKEQQVGGRTILDVLNAQQELLLAGVTLLTARREALVTAYQLLAVTGRLTARDLGLKVKLYEPRDYYDSNAGRWIGLGDGFP